MMTSVEYTSLMVMISTVKHQIAAIETVLATMSNAQQAPVRTTRKSPPIEPSHELSAEEDAKVEQSIEEFRQAELKRMAAAAENFFVKAMDDAAKQGGDPE